MTVTIKKKTKATYEQRYCAFVDILGFRKLVEGLRPETTNFEMLHGLLEIIHEPHHEAVPVAGLRAQSISDAVALSADATGDGMRGIVRVLESMTMKLLHQGYFARGALVKGSLYHDDRMVFGSALVKAYDLESSVARYPRIMVTKQIHEDVLKYDAERRSDWLCKSIKQADDGPWYVHTLRTVEADVAKAHYDNINGTLGSGPVLAEYDKYREQIQRRFDEAVDDPSHFEKIQWFAKYWNRSCPNGTFGNKYVTGPGLTETAWFAEASIPPPSNLS